jgi:hypothetical protein
MINLKDDGFDTLVRESDWKGVSRRIMHAHVANCL